ncbi:MAG: GMC family oxidoreductase N-terminal domain-containing protein [Actinobacteria bacterium]|nr:GMC family oxidoreductase N-terminal domain-containing protein [Actinomycetota bacterium]
MGSGFGGAVVAARLAGAGRSVCVLEQGRRWEPGEYPRTFSAAAGAVWDETANHGFLDYRVFSRIDVIQGVGVGGGSLHYFNVQLRAPREILDRPEWPSPLRREVLDPYYERVEAVTTPAPLVPPAGERLPHRTDAFLRAAGDAGYDASLRPIAIHTGPTREHPVSGLVQQPCTFTGDCMLGCRPRSKNSLDVTYLPMGERHGLEIRPLHAAEGIEPAPGGGYTVAVRRLDPDHPGTFDHDRVSGSAVVVAAGSVGSTELLLRARDQHRTLPGLPHTLGRRFSANGDMLFAGTKDTAELIDPSHGPSITAGAFVQRPGSRHVIQVQDLAYPAAMTSLFDGTLPIPSRVRSLAHAASGYVHAARDGRSFPTRSLFAGSFVPHFLPYLGMGTDAGDGRFRLDERGRLRLDWSPAASAGMYDEMEDAMRNLSTALGGRFVRSLPWRRPLRRLLTAHPLGGCVMSNGPSTGVVNDRGEVWGHPGLFVVDGSIVPGPLAVNPSLTIAALSERVAQWMIEGRELA